MSVCKSRHHVYVDGVCKKCGQAYRPPGRPKKVAGPEGSARLAATLGVPAPAAGGGIFSSSPAMPDQILPPQTNGTPAGAPPSPPAEAVNATAAAATAAVVDEKKEHQPSKGSKKLMSKVARKITKVFDHGTDALIEMFDGKNFEREPGDADEEDLEDFEENLRECLVTWFPDVALGPGKLCILAGASMIGDKWLGSTKVPKKVSIAGDKKPEKVIEATPAPTNTTTDDDADAPAAASTSALTLLPRSTS